MSHMSELAASVEIAKGMMGMNDINKKYAAAIKRTETLEEILEEVCSYLEGRADMIADRDGDAPNAELFLLSWIRSELSK